MLESVDRALAVDASHFAVDYHQRPMTIALDHLLVPARRRVDAAKLIASLLQVEWAEEGPVGPFSPVYVNDGLTLDFDEWGESELPTMHYCFRVDEVTFDAVLSRIITAGLPYRSLPHGPVDHRVNTNLGGRIVYWSEPDQHIWELLTVSYERPGARRRPG